MRSGPDTTPRQESLKYKVVAPVQSSPVFDVAEFSVILALKKYMCWSRIQVLVAHFLAFCDPTVPSETVQLAAVSDSGDSCPTICWEFIGEAILT